jgi:hypothetical protein
MHCLKPDQKLNVNGSQYSNLLTALIEHLNKLRSVRSDDPPDGVVIAPAEATEECSELLPAAQPEPPPSPKGASAFRDDSLLEEVVVVPAPGRQKATGELLPPVQVETKSSAEPEPDLHDEPAINEKSKPATPVKSKASASDRQSVVEHANRRSLDPLEIEAAREKARKTRELYATATCKPDSGDSTAMNMTVIDESSRDAIVQALVDGHSPRGMEPVLLAGQCDVLNEISRVLVRIANGSSEIRFLTGPNGVGETFTKRLAAELALRGGLAVSELDLNCSVLFAGAKGQARNLISEVVSGIQTPAGNGIRAVLATLADKVGSVGKKGAAGFAAPVRRILKPLEKYKLADPFRRVVTAALIGRIKGDEDAVDNAVRWLAADFNSAKEAKDLGLSAILTGDDLFDYLCLLAGLMPLCGWRGMLVALDEASIISHLPHKPTRDENWAWVLNAYNALHRGSAPHLGIMLAGTEDLLSRRTGLLSNRSLESRLAASQNGESGRILGPVIHLNPLTPEELFVMVVQARDLLFPLQEAARFPDEAIKLLLGDMFGVLGADQVVTPRDALERFALRAKQLLANPEIA